MMKELQDMVSNFKKKPTVMHNSVNSMLPSMHAGIRTYIYMPIETMDGKTRKFKKW